jgi:DsbC/DsbD-like thiol-disulfide interchange protein
MSEPASQRVGKSALRIAVALALLLASFQTQAQAQSLTTRSATKPAVTYLFPEQITVPAGKPATVELHFRISPGLHINSHTPSDEELIPTTLSFPASSGVRLENAAYPPGTQFALPLDPATKLSVYSGEFIIQTRIVAAAGNHLVEASLRYQACDNSACMPPKTITVPIDVIGK